MQRSSRVWLEAFHFSVSCCFAPLVKVELGFWKAQGMYLVFLVFFFLKIVLKDGTKENGYASCDRLCWCLVSSQIEFRSLPFLHERGHYGKFHSYISFFCYPHEM